MLLFSKKNLKIKKIDYKVCVISNLQLPRCNLVLFTYISLIEAKLFRIT